MNSMGTIETKRLDQIGEIVSGATPSTSNPDYWDGEIVWITPNDLSKLCMPYLDTSAKLITDKGLKSCSARILPPRSVTISSRAPIGYVAIPTVKFCTNQGCKSIQLYPDFDPEYVYYNICFFVDALRNVGEGTIFSEVSKSALAKVEMPFITDLGQQTQIAKILFTIDKAIAQTEAIIAKQQRIKTGLMQDLLTRGIDEHGNIRSEATHAFKDSPLGRIPVEWRPEQIVNVASLQRGHDITENELRDGRFPVISSSGIIGYHSEKTSIAPNVVVGRKGTIGKVHYLASDFWAHDTSLYVTDFHGNQEKYIFYLLEYLDLARHGTKSGSPSLNRNDIHPIWIGVPSRSEQETIAGILSIRDHLSTELGCLLQKLRRQKTALMQDLLTGKVRVTPLLAAGA